MPNARYQFSVVDAAGNVQPNAQITVRNEATGALPQLFSTRASGAGDVIGNPFNADTEGFAFFHVTAGEYRIDAELGDFARTWRYVSIGTGDRYDLFFSATGLFGAAEALPAIVAPTRLVFPAGLPGSVAYCDTAPTDEAVITFQSKTDAGAWTDAFVLTIASGETEGAFTLAADVTIEATDRLRAVMPDDSDATLDGLTVVIACLR